jgi:integrase
VQPVPKLEKRLLDTGELTSATFRSYYRCCADLVKFFGKNRLVDDLSVDDFEHLRSSLADSVGPVTLSGRVVRCRMIFKYAADSGLINRPVLFGQAFNVPSKKVLRVSRGKRMFEADELLTIIAAVSQPLKAMTLMAINCGFGQTDLANLPQSAVDLENGWVDYPRPKTGVERRCPLWPETVAAVQEAIEKRPKPQDEADDRLCFLTRFGNPWVRQGNQKDPGQRTYMDLVSTAFGKLLKKLDINGNRNFYALRHTFETIGGESRDQVAVNALMGHVDSSMAGVYRERISDERLKAVTETVRAWLWADVAEVE